MLPSAAAMIAFAYGVESLSGIRGAGWLHGLKLAAVAVVALAVWAMSLKLCPDWPRRVLGLCAAALVLLVPGTLSQIGVIAACALVGWWALARPCRVVGRAGRWPRDVRTPGLRRRFSCTACSWLACRSWRGVGGSKPLAMFDGFYRAGALVFGGGHVVLPLLRSEVVPPGWISDDAFLAGYGAAQAVPGPLFTFAAYLGTIINRDALRGRAASWRCFAIFLPGWLLVGGAYPFWHLLRSRSWAHGALRGANAAVVGILLAALYRPVCTEGIRDARDVAAAVAAAVLLGRLRVPPWGVVALMAAAGQWLLR